MLNKIFALVITPALLFTACSVWARPVGNAAVPQPAKAVALNRYLGTWYEMARYEAPFQKNCEAVTAQYSLKPNGDLQVINSCRVGSIDGKAKVAKGRAKIIPGSQNAKLKVSFFGPFFGDYWVLDRDAEYRWAIVGEPSGRYLWMLTREAKPSPEMRAQIEARVKSLGYDWGLVRVTKH